MIQTTSEIYATLSIKGSGRIGKIHRVQRFGDCYIVLCRGFVPMTDKRLNFTDSKPDCKACLKIKKR